MILQLYSIRFTARNQRLFTNHYFCFIIDEQIFIGQDEGFVFSVFEAGLFVNGQELL